jgi:hypothetical protein
VWFGAFLLVVLVVTASLTVFQSVRRAAIDRRRAAAKRALGPGLLERLASDEPDWSGWLAERSPTERRVVESEVDRLLRLLTGTDRDSLCVLATRLALGRRASDPFAVRDRLGRLEALSWLALLDVPVDIDALSRRASGPDERAAVARICHERDVHNGSALGTEALLRTADPLSLLGLDTLYRLNEADPQALLEAGAAEREHWSPALLAQVLRTIGHCEPAADDAPFEWVLACLSHEVPAVRAAAVGAIGAYNWRPAIRSRLGVLWLVADDDPAVRRAVYRHLSEHGDREDLRTIVRGAAAEPDDRALLLVAEGIAERSWPADRTPPERLEPYLEWVAAERAPTPDEPAPRARPRTGTETGTGTATGADSGTRTGSVQ